MANKDKGGRSTKKTASRSLKEKRQAKKDKAAAGKRANAVRNHLIGKGVRANRLQAVGIGSARPLTQPATDPTNKRIDFIRTEQR